MLALTPQDSSPAGAPTPEKTLRKQAWRACDRCRARRVKCDNTRPCLQCRERNVFCTNNRGVDEPRSLPQALRQIEKLRLRIHDLEAELGRYKSAPTLPSPSETSEAPSATVHRQELPVQTRPRMSGWPGVFVPSARSGQASYYGSGSIFYFHSRIGTYLRAALEQSAADRNLYPQGASATLASLTSLNVQDVVKGHPSGTVPQPSMSRTQEDYFLQLFWETYHCTLPIVEDVDFMKHYNSLWDTGRTYRKPSALVDMILALCMQYGWAFFSCNRPDTNASASSNDATIAGRWYFRRCQSLLAVDLEHPSITTVQCQIFSIAYLRNASFSNMAHMTLAQTSRMAQILGLHLEPPEDMPRGERELRKRIWSCLYTLETRMSMKLGRPSVIDSYHTTVTRPSDDIDPGVLSSAGSHAQDITWITYTKQNEDLINAAKEAHGILQEKGSVIFEQRQFRDSPYQDPQALETYAKVFAEHISPLHAWLEQLPTGMKTRRKGNGQSFSVDRSSLDIDFEAPLWVQRQRIYLELIYHNQMLNFYRTFITFPSPSTVATYSPVTRRLAVASINHAIAHTDILHQVITETDLMNGWQEFFQCQWNVTITAIGFILANPIDPSTPAARKALDKGISMFEMLGKSYAMAASAATMAKDLAAQADLLSSRLQDVMASGSGVIGVEDGSNLESIKDVGAWDGLAGTDPSQQEGSEFLGQFMDRALTVESFNSFEQFFADMNQSMYYPDA